MLCMWVDDVCNGNEDSDDDECTDEDDENDDVDGPMITRLTDRRACCSFGPASWLLLSEIYPARIRGRAMSLVTSLNWIANLIVSSTFLSVMRAFCAERCCADVGMLLTCATALVIESITPARTFALFAGVAAMAWVATYAFVPETRGIPLENMATVFRTVYHGRTCRPK
jgi:hypothetical protein